MSLSELEERPAKKRRFFVEDSPTPELDRSAQNGDTNDAPVNYGHEQTGNEHSAESALEKQNQYQHGFNSQLLENFIGEKLSDEVIAKLRDLAGEDVERAINVYLDGSWKDQIITSSTTSFSGLQNPQRRTSETQQSRLQNVVHVDNSLTHEEDRDISTLSMSSMSRTRYVGAFGVTCWATRSGLNLVEPGGKVKIERQKPQGHTGKTGRIGKPKSPALNKRQDTVVRFTNLSGAEIGRLESESASWVSPLLDQKICEFEAICVYAPERIRTNDTIYLQLRCHLLKTAFEDGAFLKPLESNRQTGLFEARETQEERDLHMRQVALVRLFNEINLHPIKTSATTEKHKRDGLLRAAEVAEKYEEKKDAESSAANGSGSSSPPSDDAEEGEELEQDQLDALYQKAQSFDFNTPEQEPTPSFIMDLRKYQKQALHWMLSKERDEKANHKEMSMHPLWEEYQWPVKDVDDQELPEVGGCSKFYVNPYSGELSLEFPVQEQHCLGGILADEMGLGKTIEMLSLIHSNQSEIAKRAAVENEEASVNDLPRLPVSVNMVVPAPCTTLVVAPMSLLAQWNSEALRASKAGTMKTMLYYGGDRSANLQSICCESNAAGAPNLIITSYGVVLSEFTQVGASGANRAAHGGLFSLDYHRVILDEAHHIKNRQSKTAKACYEIKAKHRWVLTGTPIVNRLEDLFSLIHFLKVEPWSNFSFWRTFITVPFESGEFVKALDVVQTVLEPLVIRRTKDMKTPDGQALVPLPPRLIDIESIELSKEERAVYDFIFNRAKRAFAANVEAGTLMKSYTTIFAQILRLRQSCCHPVLTRNKEVVAEEDDAAAAVDVANGLADDMDLSALIERFTAEDEEQDANKFGAHALKQIQDEAENECPICAEEPMIEQTVTGCWHSACKKCLIDYIDHQKGKNEVPRCFNCREPINARDLFEVVRHDEDDEDDEEDNQARISLRRVNQASSGKITALLSHLKAVRRAEPETKSVVFSQFTSFLDLIEPALTEARIRFLRFDGTMAQKQRAAVLSAFAEDRKTTVLLLSLRAGGVGLNLTAARRVFMMDPWWSWAVEAQAIDRVHRMGQESEVKVLRFICRESIEEKMLKIQERKKFIATSLGMMSQEEARQQRLEDIKELLS